MALLKGNSIPLEKVLGDVLDSLFNGKIKIYFSEPLKIGNKKMEIVHSCQEAQLEVGRGECTGIPLITFDYSTFEHNPNSIAVIYLDKGRIQLFFNKKGLNRYQILLPEKYQGLIP
jgi:hypothetical protein